jgi:hypothetical protein
VPGRAQCPAFAHHDPYRSPSVSVRWLTASENSERYTGSAGVLHF